MQPRPESSEIWKFGTPNFNIGYGFVGSGIGGSAPTTLAPPMHNLVSWPCFSQPSLPSQACASLHPPLYQPSSFLGQENTKFGCRSGPLTENPASDEAQLEGYQPVHARFVSVALKYIGQRLWSVRESLKRRCALNALHQWKWQLACDKLDSRLEKALDVLSHDLTLLHTHSEIESLHEKMNAIKAARRANLGAARLAIALRLTLQRHKASVVARWKDRALERPPEDRKASQALGRVVGGAAWRWNILGGSAEEVEQDLSYSAMMRADSRQLLQESLQAKAAGIWLLFGVVSSWADRAKSAAFLRLRINVVEGPVPVRGAALRKPGESPAERSIAFRWNRRDTFDHDVEAIDSDWDDGEDDKFQPSAANVVSDPSMPSIAKAVQPVGGSKSSRSVASGLHLLFPRRSPTAVTELGDRGQAECNETNDIRQLLKQTEGHDLQRRRLWPGRTSISMSSPPVVEFSTPNPTPDAADVPSSSKRLKNFSSSKSQPVSKAGRERFTTFPFGYEMFQDSDEPRALRKSMPPSLGGLGDADRLARDDGECSERTPSWASGEGERDDPALDTLGDIEHFEVGQSQPPTRVTHVAEVLPSAGKKGLAQKRLDRLAVRAGTVVL